jgi:hypothetical protein
MDGRGDGNERELALAAFSLVAIVVLALRRIRTDRNNLMERVCPHGIGHPDPDSLEWLHRIDTPDDGAHSCDGCCVEDKWRGAKIVWSGCSGTSSSTSRSSCKTPRRRRYSWSST